MDPATQPRLIEIFRAGRHTAADGRQVEFTADDLQTIAQGYDPGLAPAPLVVGHPKLDAPAYGWVDRLEVQGDVLFAAEAQVDPAFEDMRKAGRFRNRSASFYLPDSPSNPKPGQLYIKHVGWLGAAAPAVKGLKQVQFAADDQGVVEFALGDRRWGFGTAAGIFRRFRDYLIDTAGLEKADEVIPDWQISSLQEAAQPDADSAGPSLSYAEHEDTSVADDRTAEFAERERNIQERETALKQRETEQAQRDAQGRRDEAVAFADGLVKEGKLLPASKATVVELLLALPAAAPLAFGEGDDRIEQPAPQLLRDLLASFPAQISFSERSAAADDDTASLDFAAPRGTSVGADRAELYRKAKAYQAQHPTASWTNAVAAVGG